MMEPMTEANDINQDGRWNIGLPGGMNGPFYSVVKANGMIVAMQIPDRETAELIASIPLLQALAESADGMMDCFNEFDGNPDYCGECVQQVGYYLSKSGYVTE